MKKFILFLATITLIFANSNAQLTVSTGYTAQNLAEILAGNNITVTNSSMIGNAEQYGSFQFTGTGLNVSSGVILSTGDINDAVGPNSSGSTSSNMNNPGNSLLDNLAGYNTYDAVVFQFDFEVQTDMIEFKYIFLSEEYNEYVGTGFNDVFAFYISGPGITGEENLAVVPGTTTPITINTINNGSFWQFYVDNTAGGTNIEFDGFTTLMTAKKEGLIPCETYTLKLMIADGSDHAYDSGVLLEENSLVQANVSATAYTYSANDIALEGCIQASFTFNLDSAMIDPTIISLGIGGSATNGVDYAYIDSLIVIPPGQTSATITIDSYADGINEGQESVQLYYYPTVCGEVDTILLFIDDNTPIEFGLSGTNLICAGDGSGELDITITGGTAPYTITLTDTTTGIATDYPSSALPITGLDAETYLVEISDNYGCYAEALVVGGNFDAGQTFLPDGTGVSYDSDIIISGFNTGQTLISENQINSICANMEHSYANDLTIVLEAPNGSQVMLKNVGPTGGDWNKCNMGEPVASGPVDNWNSSNITPGVGYEYCWTNTPTFLTMGDEIQNHNVPWYTYVSTWGNTLSDYYLPAGAYTSVQSLAGFIGTELNGTWTLHVTDNYNLDNGYIFNWNISLTSDLPDSTITLTEPNDIIILGGVTSAACGSTDGSIDITPSGDEPPFTFLWSTGATTEDISGIGAGSYTVTVTDNNGCENDTTYNVPNFGAVTFSVVIADGTCVGANDGSIDLTPSGTAPFTFVWSNTETTEDIINLAPGNYTVSVTDGNGCIGIETYSVGEASPIEIVATITDENCGDGEGIIDITVSGGTSAYTFVWSASATSEDITDLSQGEYIVSVTDGNTCLAVDTFTIVNYVGNCVPNCDLEISSFLLSNETCGNGDGLIDITISTTFTPYTVNWSNGSSSEDQYNLVAGTYTVTILDAENCEHIEDFVINNQTGTLAITSVIASNETCGNGFGGVNLTVSGGAQPYTFIWSNGASTEDLVNISAGTYDVTIIDANNCSVFNGTTVYNEVGTLSLDYGNAANEICGNGQGSIDIIVSGGNTPYTFNWSNGATTEDIIGLSAGNYYCDITDDDGCVMTTPIYTVNNEAGTLSLNFIDIDNEICDNNLGEIVILVSGGATPYTFLWSNAATTQNIYNLSEGLFSGTITDNNGCSVNTGNLNLINEAGTLQQNGVSSTDEICGNGLGAVNIDISGGTLPYSFNWNNGSTSEDLINVNAGSYSCTITDNVGCEITLNSTVSNDPGTLSLSNTITADENCGNSDGSIDLVISGGTTPINYLWNSGQTTQDISSIIAGTYTCTITDNFGCSTTANANITNQSGSLSVDNYSLTNEVCGNALGAIDIMVTGLETPITFNWSNSETTEDITDLSAGTYQCTVTDNLGCNVIAGPYTVNNSSGSLSLDNVLITDENCGDGTGLVDLTISGGTVPITFAWSNAATTEDINSLSAGTFSYTITDLNNCSIIGDAVVNNNAGSLSLDSYQIIDELCNNGSGEIDITVSGGALPYTFAWSSGPSSEDLTNLSDGTYIITITDNNGCQITSSSLEVNNNPGSFTLVDINVNNESCGDGTGSLDVILAGGTNPIFYNWSTSAVSQDISGLSAGIYSCTTTDANNCELTYSEIVGNNSGSLSIDNALVTDETCNDFNGEIDITLSGGTLPYTFSWNTGDLTEDIVGVDAGNYTCVITDAAGCSTSYNGVVNNIGGNLSITNILTTNEFCGNNLGSVDITISGGTIPYAFDWSSGQTTEDIANLTGGTYFVTITDGLGCTTATSITIINHPGYMSIDDIIITDENCGDSSGEIDITYSGGTEPVVITWSNGSNDEDIEYLGEGTYTVTIVDVEGCQVIENATVLNETGGFVIDNSIVVDENCGDGLGDIDLTLTGGSLPYTIIWSNGATTEDLSNLSEGTYTCSITDNTGCMLTITEQINNVTNGLLLQSYTTGNDYCNSGTGNIDQIITGGITPYSFTWSNGANTEDLVNVVGGTYDVTITDNTGCNIYSQYTIINDVNNNLGYTSITITNDNCGQGIGVIDFQPWATGYSYEIDGIASGSPLTQFSNLNEDTYIISIVDFGCRIDSMVTVGNDVTFSVLVDNIVDENCGNSDGAAYISVVPGTGTYTYNWSNGTYNANLIGVNAGTYTCNISDGLGCHDVITVDIVNNATFTASTIILDESCGDGSGSIDITTSGTTGTVNYLWNTGATTEDLTGLIAGQYSCTITDDNCTVFVNEEVINNTGILYVSSVVANDFCNEGQAYISLSIIGGSGNYDILWDTGATLDSLFNLTAGNYSVTVTDLTTTCVYTDSYIVESIGYFTVTDAITSSGCQTCSDGEIDLTINGSSPNYYFIWDNGATTEDITGLLPGTYTVTINDDWACESVETYTVGYLLNQLSISSITGNDSCNTSIGFIEIMISNGSGNYSYIWSNSDTTQNIYDLNTGTYYVTVNDNITSFTITESYSIINIGNYTLSSGITNASCQTCSDGAINLTVSGSSGYTFNWSNGATSEDITDLLPGMYTVTITDIGNCETVETYEITYPSSQFVVTATLENDSCNNAQGFIELVITGGSGNYSYNWSTGATTSDIYNLSAGTYTVTITDNISAYSQVETHIINNIGGYTVSALLTSAMCPTCNDGAIDLTLTGSSGYTFLWDNAATTEDIAGLLPGSYTVAITDVANCEMVETYIVGYQPNSLYATATIVDDSCNLSQGYIELLIGGGSGNYSFNWSNAETTQDIYNLAMGTYDLTITDNITSYTLIESYYVNNIGSYTVSEMINNSSCGTCNDGGIDLTLAGSSGYTFIWSNAETTEDISGLLPGSYTVTITDVAGCEVIETYVVAYPQYQLTVSHIVVDDTCNTAQGYIQLIVSGGTGNYSYLWSTGATTQDLTNLTTGTYDVTITDNITGYTLMESYTVNSIGSFTLSSSVSDASCGTCGDGNIDQTLIGSSGYTFVWDNGATTEDLTNLLPGTYTVTITDGSACESVETYTIGYPANLLTLTEIISNDSCNNALGFIEIIVDGGSGDYSYNWSNGATSQNIYSLTAGIYSVTVTDNITAYTIIDSYTIVNIGSYTLSASVTDATCGTCNDGIIDLTLAGSSGYTFIWSNTEITEDITNLLPGTYTVTISDIGACEMVETYFVGYPSNQLSSTAVITEDTCSASVGSIVLTVSGGTGDYNYIWSNGATTQNIYNLLFGTYDVTITDNITAYTYTDSYIVNFLGSLTVSSSINDATCGTCPDGSIDLTVTGSGIYTYNWDTGDTIEDIYNLLPGTYSVTITDDLGCEYIGSFIVNYSTLIADTKEEFNISVYPNPTTGIINIDYDLGLSNKAEIVLYNVIGKIIIETKIDNSSGIKQIDLKDNLPGLYFVRISNNNFTKTIKLVLSQ